MKILIADPIGLRRDRLAQWLGRVPGVVVTAVDGLAPAYVAAESAPPDVTALASELASRSEFEGFYALLRAVQSDFAIFGDPRHLPEGARCSLLRNDGDYLELVTRLTGGPMPVAAPEFDADSLILIGASTGGLSAIETVLSSFPENCPATVIVQHMRDGFIRQFVRRLDRDCAPRVLEAVPGARLGPGEVHVATDDAHHLAIQGRGRRLTLRQTEAPPMSGHRPSVDVLFDSVAAIRPESPVAAALLTGMGGDGARGLLALRRNGAHTITQDRATSTVWGMPRLAVELGAAVEELPVGQIGRALLSASARAQRRLRPAS